MCIKPFTFNNTIFSVSFLNDISPFKIFFKHTIIELDLRLDRTLLTNSSNIHKWYSFPNAPIFHNSVAICFNIYAIFTFKSSG